MKKYLYFVLKCIVFCGLCTHGYWVFAFSGANIIDKTKSVFDAPKDFKVSETNTVSDMDFLILGKDFKLKSFFRLALSDSEKTILLWLINNYVFQRERLETIINQKNALDESVIDEKKELLNEKKEFYKNILIYIKVDMMKAYIDYIASDIKEFVDKNEPSSSMSDSGTKIEKIEGKIIEHSNALDLKFKVLMEEKINDNIIKLTNNPQFQSLKLDQKNTILESLMKKIDAKLVDLNKIWNTTDTFNKQKEVYTLLNQKLLNLQNTLNK